MTISQWSETPGSNTSITDGTYGNINAAEGQAPNTVNNDMRSIMAHIRNFYESMEWRDFGHTVTRASDTTFTIGADVTADYVAGRRIKLNDSSTLYGLITASSFSSPNTTVTVLVDGGTALSSSLDSGGVELGIDPTNNPYPDFTLSASPVLAPHKNLVVKYASDTTVDVDADEILLSDGTNFLKLSSVDYTITVSGTGLNGLDTGTFTANTEYHVFQVSDGSTHGAIASTSSTWAGVDASITGTYTYYGYIGAFFADATADVINFHQKNNSVVRSSSTILSGGTSTSYAAVGVSSAVPSTASKVSGTITVSENNDATIEMRVASDTAGLGEQFVYLIRSVSGATVATSAVGAPFSLLLLTSNIYYKVNAGTESGNIYITGWEY